MILVTRSFLALGQQNCPEILERIARNLASADICAYEEFMEAVAGEDAEKVNTLLENAIKTYTGEDNPVYGLRLFCEKFGLDLIDQMAREKQLLEFISSNTEIIEKKISEYS